MLGFFSSCRVPQRTALEFVSVLISDPLAAMTASYPRGLFILLLWTRYLQTEFHTRVRGDFFNFDSLARYTRL